jgi:hypothetical protein
LASFTSDGQGKLDIGEPESNQAPKASTAKNRDLSMKQKQQKRISDLKQGPGAPGAFNFGFVNFASDSNSNFNDDGNILATDLDFFETEIRRL